MLLIDKTKQNPDFTIFGVGKIYKKKTKFKSLLMIYESQIT
jgi:hypothetical protein